MKKLLAVAAIGILLAGCGMPAAPSLDRGATNAMQAQKARLAGDYAKARAWVLANSGGSYWDDEPKKHLFPAVDDGNIGTSGAAYGGADGKWMAEFADTWFKNAYKKPPTFSYDPARHLMVVVATSDDEPVMMVALYDKAAGKGQLLDEIQIVNLGYTLKQDAFSRFFPKLGNVDDVDSFDMLTAAMARGVDLKLQPATF